MPEHCEVLVQETWRGRRTGGRKKEEESKVSAERLFWLV